MRNWQHRLVFGGITAGCAALALALPFMVEALLSGAAADKPGSWRGAVPDLSADLAFVAGAFASGWLLTPLWRRGIGAQVLAGLVTPGLSFMLVVAPALAKGLVADPLQVLITIFTLPFIVGAVAVVTLPLAVMWLTGFILASCWGSVFSLQREREEEAGQPWLTGPGPDQSRK